MRIKNLIALCSMLLMSGATISGAQAQQTVVQLNAPMATYGSGIESNSIWGGNATVLRRTMSAVLPPTDAASEIATPSILAPATLLVNGFGYSGCNTAIILPEMADMPSDRLAPACPIVSNAAVIPAAPVCTKTTTIERTTTIRRFFHEVRVRRPVVHRQCQPCVMHRVIRKRPSCILK